MLHNPPAPPPTIQQRVQRTWRLYDHLIVLLAWAAIASAAICQSVGDVLLVVSAVAVAYMIGATSRRIA